MEELAAGLYEVLVTEGLQARLDELAERLPDRAASACTPAEAPDRIAWHLSREIERALDRRRRDRPGPGRDRGGPRTARSAGRAGRVLTRRCGPSIRRRCCMPCSAADPTARPERDRRAVDPAARHDVAHRTRRASRTCGTSCAPRSSRRTRSTSSWPSSVAAASPRCSTRSPALRSTAGRCGCSRPPTPGRPSKRALDQLTDLGAEVRVSYDLSTTRLHAKAWVFHRHSGFSTAYVGSSNLTHSAQVTGMEWNVRASAARNPDRDREVRSCLRQLLGRRRLPPLRRRAVRGRAANAPGATDSGPTVILSPIELRPLPFQERLLELRRGVASARPPPQPPRVGNGHRQDRHGRPRLRPVSATSSTARRLLFIAHREEILDQSLATFRYALRDPSFGEKWVGGARPSRFEHVFASIQSLHAADLVGARSRPLRRGHRRRVPPRRRHELREGARPPRTRRAARAHRDTRTQRRAADPALVRRPDRRRAAAVGRHRPAVPGPVPVLRHPRRPRPARHPVAARSGLRGRGAHQPLHQLRRLGPPRREAARRARRRRLDALPRLLREHRARPVHGAPLQPPRDRLRRHLGRQPDEPSGRPRCGISPPAK